MCVGLLRKITAALIPRLMPEFSITCAAVAWREKTKCPIPAWWMGRQPIVWPPSVTRETSDCSTLNRFTASAKAGCQSPIGTSRNTDTWPLLLKKKSRKPPNKNLLQKKAGHIFFQKCPAEINSNFLVAIVVPMLFVPAFVLAVVFMPATVVPTAVMVPVMVVLESPARTSPVATVVAAVFIVWNDPDRANVRRTRPVAAVPVIVTFHRIPVAVDPRVLVFIFGIGAWRANG